MLAADAAADAFSICHYFRLIFRCPRCHYSPPHCFFFSSTLPPLLPCADMPFSFSLISAFRHAATLPLLLRLPAPLCHYAYFPHAASAAAITPPRRFRRCCCHDAVFMPYFSLTLLLRRCCAAPVIDSRHDATPPIFCAATPMLMPPPPLFSIAAICCFLPTPCRR